MLILIFCDIFGIFLLETVQGFYSWRMSEIKKILRIVFINVKSHQKNISLLRFGDSLLESQNRYHLPLTLVKLGIEVQKNFRLYFFYIIKNFEEHR